MPHQTHLNLQQSADRFVIMLWKMHRGGKIRKKENGHEGAKDRRIQMLRQKTSSSINYGYRIKTQHFILMPMVV